VHEIQLEHLYEAILSRPESILNNMASTANLGLFSEFKVHLFDGVLKKGVIVGLGEVFDHMEKSIENQHLGGRVNFAVLHAELGHVV